MPQTSMCLQKTGIDMIHKEYDFDMIHEEGEDID